MKNKEIINEAQKYIEQNKIEKNTYQVEKAFIDGAKMALKQIKNLNIPDVSGLLFAYEMRTNNNRLPTKTERLAKVQIKQFLANYKR